MLREHERSSRRSRPLSRPLFWLGLAISGLLVGAAAAIVVLATRGGGQGSPKTVLRTADITGLDVLPFPGTPDASSTAQVMFPALVRSEVESVTVTGSRSGRHEGRIQSLPAGRGTAFVPAQPFRAGERVSVRARLSEPAAGTASGAPDQTELRFSFTVARSASGAAAPAKPSTGTAGSARRKPAKPQPTQSFRSAPSLRPPTVKASGDPGAGSGDVLLTAQDSPQQGPMILDGNGKLVWFRPVSGKHTSALDLNMQSYRGKPVLTWWQGRVATGYGTDGEDVILNQHYQTVAVLHAGEGYSSDLHEFQLTPLGTALVTAYVPVKADLSSVGGPRNGTVLDGVVQEIDVATGRVVWEWHALGHIPLSASELGKPKAGQPYDYFHINSIQQLPDGNLLISARNTWGLYEISRTTGKVIWTLGGKDSSFKMGGGTNFEWQHDPRMQSNGTLTLFDDGASPKEESQSRALELSVNTSAMTVALKRAYEHTPSVLAIAEGSAQLLRDGSVFVGWGTEPDFSQYTADGRQVWNGSFTTPVQSYRAFRASWSAHPGDPPAISVSRGTGHAVTVYASWNGATDVARWQVLAGSSPDDLTAVSTATKRGFETAIRAGTSGRYLAVRALGRSGRVLGTSKSVSR